MLVWLVSYPRSGNTFSRVVMNHYFSIKSYSLSGDVSDMGLIADLGNFVGHRSGDNATIDLSNARRSEEVVVVKTHGLPDSSMSKEDTILYITRDGRDSVASLYYYNRDFLNNPFISWSEVICGQFKPGTWGNHALRWHQTDYPNMHSARYEDITRDPAGYAARLGRILNRTPSDKPFPSFDRFRQADGKFFRVGISGGWRAAFGPQELVLFDFINEPAMRLLNYAEGEVSDDELKAYSRLQARIDENYVAGRCDESSARLQDELNKKTRRLSKMEKAVARKNRQIRKIRRKWRKHVKA